MIPLLLATVLLGILVSNLFNSIVSDKKKKQKKVINKDKIKSDWENLLTVYADELSHLKKKPEQKQSLLKALRELKSDSFRLMKIRNKADKKNLFKLWHEASMCRNPPPLQESRRVIILYIYHCINIYIKCRCAEIRVRSSKAGL